MTETHETAVEHLRHAVMYEAELRRQLLAALRELEGADDPEDDGIRTRSEAVLLFVRAARRQLLAVLRELEEADRG
jgi:hypothetical protein